MVDPELQRLNAQLAELTSWTKAVDAGTAAVLQAAAVHLAECAVRATVAGLVDAEATLMEAARSLHAIAAGSEGDVAAIIESVRPLVAELRAAAQTVAGSNLEKTLLELEGSAGATVTNEDRVGGSVDTNPPLASDRDRYEPKSRDEDLRAKLEELGPTPKPEPKPPGRWTYDVPQRFIPVEEAS